MLLIWASQLYPLAILLRLDTWSNLQTTLAAFERGVMGLSLDVYLQA